MRTPLIVGALFFGLLMVGLIFRPTAGPEAGSGLVDASGRRLSPAAAERERLRQTDPERAALLDESDRLWGQSQQIQRRLHLAATPGEREELLEQFASVVERNNDVQDKLDAAPHK
jgi:hypothetical protein